MSNSGLPGRKKTRPMPTVNKKKTLKYFTFPTFNSGLEHGVKYGLPVRVQEFCFSLPVTKTRLTGELTIEFSKLQTRIGGKTKKHRETFTRLEKRGK